MSCQRGRCQGCGLSVYKKPEPNSRGFGPRLTDIHDIPNRTWVPGYEHNDRIAIYHPECLNFWIRQNSALTHGPLTEEELALAILSGTAWHPHFRP